MSNRFRDRNAALYGNALSASNNEIRRLTAGRSNAIMADLLGRNLETKRNLICQYGYPEAPVFADFYAMYKRCGPAEKGCDSPVDSVWSDWPEIQDVTKFKPNGDPDYTTDNSTEFEVAVNALFNDPKLALKDRVRSLDRKQRLGDYAASLIVARDNNGAKMDQPLENLMPGQLVKLVPLYESQVEELQWDTEPTSETYGEPTMYQVNEFATGAKSLGQNRSFMCHPSRLILAAEGAEDGTNQGKPAMESCFYALMDWEKLRMSSAEGSKKNADQRSVISLKEGSNLPTGETAETMDENIEEFDNGDLSTLLISDASMSALNSTMGDPTKTAEICEKEISAGFDMPSTELFGYQTGKLASEKDGLKWANSIMDRRNGFGTHLLNAHLMRFIDLGLLPQPSGTVIIDWADARDPSQSDKLDMAEKAASVRQKIGSSGGVGENVIPDSYFHELLDINTDEIDLILDDEPAPEGDE